MYEYFGTIDDLAGWFGDLRTLAADVYKDAIAENDLTEEYVVNATKERILNNIYENKDKTHFPFEDLVGDADAVNTNKLLKTTSLPEALTSYYEGDGYKTRFSSFVKEEFGSLDKLEDKAYNYLITYAPDIEVFF